MKGLTLRGISKSFGDRTAVDRVSLEIIPGEFFSLLGPSGSGKSTLLRIVAGLERPDSGSVLLGEQEITAQPPQQRGIGMVFQNYALFPHMTVEENVAFGLRLRNIPDSQRAERVREALERVDLAGRGRERVVRLSGGEQQRVAVARAIVIEPHLLLFDEPLSNLDVTLRQRTRMEIRALQKRTGITALYVTHDQAEALSVSDRIAVIRNGHVEQVDTPARLYHTPDTAFVAGFLGWENVFEGEVDPVHHCIRMKELGMSIPRAAGMPEAGPVLVVLAPEMVRVVTSEVQGGVAGIIEGVEFRGSSSLIILRLGGVKVQALVSGDRARQEWTEGQSVAAVCEWPFARVYRKEMP
jgi:iron(III) transport system ATP-binding protein